MNGLSSSALSNKDKLGMVKDVDGNWYKTVIIGTQVWMAENLKTTRFNDKTKIPLVSEDIAWNALSTPGYCWYNNRTTNKTVYGALYNWYAISTGKLCPTEWHVPSDAEWHDLILYFDPSAELTVMPVYESLTAGNQLKEIGTTHWTETDINVTNVSGFSALPAGSRDSYGNFNYIGTNGYWWTSSATEPSSIYAWVNELAYNFGNESRFNSYIVDGLSVRCVKDN
jgi:uncharacterized protein (TIGR02145 family)